MDLKYASFSLACVSADNYRLCVNTSGPIWMRGVIKTMKTKQIEILTRILNLAKRPGPIRAFFIGMLFPEFEKILGELAELSETV
jgi:hypothetical protein